MSQSQETLSPAEFEQLRQEVNALMPSHQLKLDPVWARKVLNTLQVAMGPGVGGDLLIAGEDIEIGSPVYVGEDGKAYPKQSEETDAEE